MTEVGPRQFVGATTDPNSPWAIWSATANTVPTPSGVPATPEYVYTFVPSTASATNIAALQTTAGAANFTLTAGAGSTSTTIGGVSVIAVSDVPSDTFYRVARNVTLTSAGNISAVTFTITGFDARGVRVVQTLAGPNANTVATTKTFAAIISIATSAAVGTNTSAGWGDVFGLPIACSFRGFVSFRWDTGATEDAGTFVAAVTTSPATATTGDVRGTYTPSSASNGTRRLAATIQIPDANLFTPSLVYGVTQFGG